MSSKPNILIVGDYNRKSYIDHFEASKDYFNFYFIEFISPKEVLTDYHREFGKAIFWGDYKDAFDLLNKLQPSKVIFFYIESYFHTTLNLACKIKNIKTYHLEHGIRDLDINVRLEAHLPKKFNSNNSQELFNKISQFRSRLKGRFFLLNTIRKLPQKDAKRLKEFIALRGKSTYIETIKKTDNLLLTPDIYIAYSPRTFAVHQHYHKLSNSQAVHFIGIPVYDHFADNALIDKVDPNIIFIDQGLPNRNFFGWNEANYSFFLKNLSEITSEAGYNLFIKPHPSHSSFLKTYSDSITNLNVINNSELEALIPKTKVIIGFFSTYLLPLISLKHTVIITLENHPAGKLDVSKPFIEAGVVHPVHNMKDLKSVLSKVDEFHKQQICHKESFTREWMYQLDGKAGERLRDILLSLE